MSNRSMSVASRSPPSFHFNEPSVWRAIWKAQKQSNKTHHTNGWECVIFMQSLTGKSKLCAQVSVNKWKSIYHSIKFIGTQMCRGVRSSTCSCTTYLFILHAHAHTLSNSIFDAVHVYFYGCDQSNKASIQRALKQCFLLFVQFRIGILLF